MLQTIDLYIIILLCWWVVSYLQQLHATTEVSTQQLISNESKTTIPSQPQELTYWRCHTSSHRVTDLHDHGCTETEEKREPAFICKQGVPYSDDIYAHIDHTMLHHVTGCDVR